MMKETIMEAGKKRLGQFLRVAESISTDQMGELVGQALMEVAKMAINERRLLNETEVSDLYPLSVGYLRKKRYEGGGPAFYKFGNSSRNHVYYRIRDLETWIDKNRQTDQFLARVLAQV